MQLDVRSALEKTDCPLECDVNYARGFERALQSVQEYIGTVGAAGLGPAIVEAMNSVWAYRKCLEHRVRMKAWRRLKRRNKQLLTAVRRQFGYLGEHALVDLMAGHYDVERLHTVPISKEAA
jgi:hypothetical protein